MINYWWVTRPKRKLTEVPEILALFAETALHQQWTGQRTRHLEIEEALEREGLKRTGQRRDQTGGGARTYRAWIESLGLLFRQEGTGLLHLTLAGEDMMTGRSPVEILTAQVLKYQFPSSFSISPGVRVHERFRIRPFRFLLRLLAEPGVESLTEEEIAKIIAVEAEDESQKCFRKVVLRLQEFRELGDKALDADFAIRYASSRGGQGNTHPLSHLFDLANTLVNWLEYTQLIGRSDGKIFIPSDKRGEVERILSFTPSFIDRPEHHEYFQRKFGTSNEHKRDNRDLLTSTPVSTRLIAEKKIQRIFLSMAVSRPIHRITKELINEIENKSGYRSDLIEEALSRNHPRGAISAFLSEYYHMAYSGREKATDFELATVTIFQEVFGFRARHVGPQRLSPDVLVVSETEKYTAIIDNKAYSAYSISNDHRNRLVHNYIPKFRNYEGLPLAFFTYIAGGFGTTATGSIQSVAAETGIHGSGIAVSNLIRMIETQEKKSYGHRAFRSIFSADKVILGTDLDLYD